MNTADAWRILGREWTDIVREMSSLATGAQRVERAEFFLSNAKKTARSIMAENHPDRRPGDDDAAIRFRMAQEALRAIESDTESMKAKFEAMREDAMRRAASDGYIIIK